MAFRGILHHPKTLRLMAVLPQFGGGVVGFLETLWQFTAEQCPQGEITKYIDDLEACLHWPGEPGVLVKALVQCRWLDVLPLPPGGLPESPGVLRAPSVVSGRVWVHDWHEHSDSYVHAWLLKRTLLFANGEAPRLSHERFDGRQRTRIRAQYLQRHMIVLKNWGFGSNTYILPESPGVLPESSGEIRALPVPVPDKTSIPEVLPVARSISSEEKQSARAPSPTPPKRLPESSGRNGEENGDYSRDDESRVWAEKVYEGHPTQTDQFESIGLLREEFFLKQNAEQNRALFEANYPQWIASPQWQESGGRFVPSLKKFILDHRWKKPPRKSVSSIDDDALQRRADEETKKGIGRRQR